MGDDSNLKAATGRLRDTLLALGRITPMRDPLSDAAALDLSAAQVHVLVRLGDEESLTMSELAARLDCTLPACTRLVDRMKESGYLLRERDQSDRRVVRVRLASEGQRLFGIIDAHMTEKMEMTLALLEPEDREQLVRIVERLSQALAARLAQATEQAS